MKVQIIVKRNQKLELLSTAILQKNLNKMIKLNRRRKKRFLRIIRIKYKNDENKV
jgi:hypothetical protein